MPTCLDCPAPARVRGYCSAHYQAHRRAGDLAAIEPTHQLALRIPLSTLAALQAESERTGEPVSTVALRWLSDRARLDSA